MRVVSNSAATSPTEHPGFALTISRILRLGALPKASKTAAMSSIGKKKFTYLSTPVNPRTPGFWSHGPERRPSPTSSPGGPRPRKPLCYGP